MTEGDAVFAADGAHIGQIDGLDEEWLTVRGESYTYRLPRAEVAYEHENRVFLTAPNRSAAHLWRVDLQRRSGLRGWWDRHVLGPSPHHLGGRLTD